MIIQKTNMYKHVYNIFLEKLSIKYFGCGGNRTPLVYARDKPCLQQASSLLWRAGSSFRIHNSFIKKAPHLEELLCAGERTRTFTP